MSHARGDRIYVGIDVGAGRWHCAALDDRGDVTRQAALATDDPDALAAWSAAAAVVAIDAPESPSTAPHDGDTTLAPKFRAARCAEIELGRSHGSWVSWIAPAAAPFPSWMQTGFLTFAALRRQNGPELLEVYPHAGFRAVTGGRRLPRKRSAPGRQARAALLTAAGVAVDDLAAGSHDGLDALMAALVARDRALGRAERVTCGHDGSALWLPGVPRD